MKMYDTPSMVAYGSIASITGESGTNGQNDIFVTKNGDEIERGFTGSVDGCAKPPGEPKCCFPDDQSKC